MTATSNLERGQRWLDQVLEKMSLPCRTALDQERDWLVIDHHALTPDQLEALLGPQGAVLDALQFLANVTLNLGVDTEQQHPYTLELRGHRAQRLVELQSLAETAVAEVRQTGQPLALPPMSAAERRQMHTLLKVYAAIETSSSGQEPHRHLVIRPVGV